jgi:transcriptional regulator of acetoin/glycerol metabolism
MYPHPATLGRDPGTERRPHVTSEADGDPNLDRAIIRHIRRVLDGVRGNKLQAARLLGISRSTLYRLLSGDGGGAEDKARE